jgi:hypothetical protein
MKKQGNPGRDENLNSAMPKEIRFSKLIQKAGKPETVSLWTKPKDNPAFMKAIDENRVITVFQKPTGTKKDFGLIGFHQEKFAAYLVFPKPLPQLGEVHVIGIKYELLKEQQENRPVKKDRQLPKTAKKTFIHNGWHPIQDGASKSKAKIEPVKKFEVRIVRIATIETTITISAKNISEAETKALETVKTQNFEPDDVHDEVKSIAQI